MVGNPNFINFTICTPQLEKITVKCGKYEVMDSDPKFMPSHPYFIISPEHYTSTDDKIKQN